MRIKNHLLCLARIGNGKRHPAMAQFEVSDLHGGEFASHHYLFFAPVELVDLPRVKD